MPDTFSEQDKLFQTVLITGGTGSLGQALTRFLLDHTDATIRIYSRSELPQALMQQAFRADRDRLRFFLGDVRDLARLHTAMVGVDLAVHAAALKRIDQGEYDVEEFASVNVTGTSNVIRACRSMGVKRAVLIGTDKSVHSINSYGVTKALAERLWTRANGYAPHGTEYSTVRYGNISSSRGSVIPLWQQALREEKPLGITHAQMSRFWISLDEAVRLVWFAAQYAPRGSILIPHLPAYSVKALAQAVVTQAGYNWEHVAWQDIGIRPGEKMAELLQTSEERATALTYTEDGVTPLYYCLPPVEPSWPMPSVEAWPTAPSGQWRCWPMDHPYASDTWPYRLGLTELCQRLRAMDVVVYGA